ncbi:lipoyl protein ligase domain-containing protein [Cupriavidus sp. M-11]|uniref:lipoyl protein ligase domain-containing protein n=1 Tax=Cupriavidus sp. M-11 TaxID=3233038 RepID=UPI003F93E2D1
MSFAYLTPDPTDPDPLRAEQAMLEQAAAGRWLAHLWQAPVSLVVPRSYLRHAQLEAGRSAFAARGCPVWLRLSGGGLVPQGPGILNLSLAYPVRGGAGTHAEAVYLHLCEVLAGALSQLGLRTHWQAVDGSFCDGRFNLAWGPAADARKIAGTAQYWRRVAGAADASLHVVLAHAVLLVSADPEEINQRANAFEAAIGSGRQYRADKVVSVAGALAQDGLAVPAGLPELTADALRHALRANPPAFAVPGI